MGTLAELHRKGRMGARTINRNPLRKIVRQAGGPAGKELLECGHEQHPRQDFIGITNAVRRRCWQCARAQQKGLDQ